MAKTADQSQVFLYDLGGETVEVAREHRDAFLRENPKAQGVGLYDAGGETFEVADSDLEAFRAANPTAERVHLFDDPGGETVEVSRRDIGAYIGSRAGKDKDRSLASYAGEAYADAGRKAANTAKAVGKAAGKVVEGTGDVLGRVPANLEALGDRIVAGPLLLAGRVADALNPDPLAGPVDVLTGQRGRYSPQEMGYEEDPYKQGLASRTADKARAWLARRDEARAPKTAAGRVADVPVGFATQAVAFGTPAGPMMMVGNAAEAGDRAYAEGASGAGALGRTAASLGTQAVVFGNKIPLRGASTGTALERAAAGTATRKTVEEAVQKAADPLIRVPGTETIGKAVEGAAARIGGRLAQTPEGAARAVRTAVTAGQVARGAVDSGARMAAVTAADGGDAKDVLIAGAVGGVVGGTLRGVSTRPTARVAGEAARRMAGVRVGPAPESAGGAAPTPPRGGVETPPRGLSQGRAEPGGASSPSEPPPQGLPGPARAGLPAPAEPGAVPTVYGQRTIVPPYYGPTISRPGEPITPPAPYADKVPEPIPETKEEVVRRRKEALDALPLPQRLKKTGFSAYYDQFPDRGAVLDAIGFQNFAKLYRKYKGDFRNVTGDLVNAGEVGGIVGRDYSGADGVRRALEDAAQEYDAYRRWKEEGAPTAEEEMQTGQEVAWNRAQNAEAEAEVRRRYELTHPEATGEPRVTDEMIRDAAAAAEEGEVARIEAEARFDEEPVAGDTTPTPNNSEQLRTTPNSVPAAPIADSAPPTPNNSEQLRTTPNGVAGSATPPRQGGTANVVRPAPTRLTVDQAVQAELRFRGLKDKGLVRAQVEKELLDRAYSRKVADMQPFEAEMILRDMENGTDGLFRHEIPELVADLREMNRTGQAAQEARREHALAATYSETTGAGRDRAARKAQRLLPKIQKLNQEAEEAQARFEEAHGKWMEALRTKAAEGKVPADFALDGGTPAEIDAEKARAAEAQKRAALEEQAAAPGKDLGTVTIQEGLPGIGGDGTLFTPPAGGWSGRVASGPSLGDAATAAPSLVGTGRENPAPAVTDTLGAPREGAAQKRAKEDDAAAVRARTALVKWEAGDGNEAEMRACISELEGRSLYASARDLKAAMGEATPRPGLSTQGAHEVWPVAEPGALARVSMRDLVEAATALGSGRAPEVVKRLRLLHGTALGSYRLGGGPVTMRSDLWQLVDREERADLRAKAREQAAEELPGADPKEIAARSDELFDQFLDDAIRRNAQDDAPVAAQVLAHELGHWLDDLPDGLRGRGNILGRLASLKDYLATTLFKNPADALGRDPFLTAQERDEIYKEADKGVRRKDFPSQAAFEAARRRAREQALGRVMLERGLASAPVVRAELDDLIAWYRQSDHAPEYFRKGEEMFAEAFSAYLNYPMTARAKAPTFCDLLEAWGSKKGEIWKAVQELQRREPVFASTQGPWRQRFAERMRAATGAWYALENFRPKDLPGSLRETWDRAANYALAAFSGELRWVDRYSRILEKARTGRIRENGWGTREGAAAREAVHAYTHASTKAEAEMVRFRTQVLPVVEQGGATIQDFDVYLTLYRVANELLGADKTRGAMNLPNPGGLTPAAAKAELENWERTEPASFRACKRAQEIFAGIRRETVLSLVEKYGGLNPEGLEQILANDAYARFLKLFAPPEEYRRRAAQGEMRATSGIRRRELGDLAQNVSPSLATLLGDAQIMFDVSLNGARRDAVNLLRVAAPGAVRPARLVWNPARKRMEPEQINTPGWRTVVWLENGKPTGADVRSWAAYGLRGPQSRDPSVLDPVVDALEYAGRANSAAITFLSYTFGLRNPIRDRFNMARNLPLSQEGGAFEATFGPVPTVIQSLWSGMGRARETGEGSPEQIEALLRALDAGALPSASFSGRSHRQDTAAKLAALFQAGTDPEKFRAAADDVVRSLGIDPALLRGQKKTLGVLSPLLEKAARAYTWLPSRLARTETNAKVTGYEAVRLAHPDWPEARVAEFVARSVGTPDPTAPSALAQIRGLRAFLPFYTMTYRGFVDGYLAPWRDQAGLMALRLSSHLVWRFLTHPAVLLGAAAGAAGFGGGIVGALREAAAPGEGEDPEDVSLYKRGLAAVADALEFVGKCMAAVSPFDRGTGHQIPLWCVDEATKKYAYLQIPDAQEMTPIDAAFDYLVDVASGRNQMPAEQAADAVVNGLVPNVGVVPRSLVAATAGVDLGQGLQEVHRDPETTGFWESRAEALGAQWDIWTGRGWGALQWRNGIRAVLDDEEKTAVEKFLALPGVVNTIRPFLRVTNQGDAQTAKMIKAWAEKGAKQNQQDAKEAAKANLRIDARFERGEEDAAADAEDERIAEEAVERIAETGAAAGEMVRGARKRLEERRTLSPSERAIRALPRRQREEARERFGIPEPD